MQLAVIDAAFPLAKQPCRGLAARWLVWELSRKGIKEATVESADILLVTCVDPMQASFIKGLKRKYPNKLIIVGGAGGTSPYSLGLYADMVCVGDGQAFIHTLITEGLEKASALSNIWVRGERKTVCIDQSFPWHCPPIKAQDKVVRLWCGRGCKNKCLFCQTGWALEYSEHPCPDELIRQARKLMDQGQRINYLSNDPNQHSFSKMLPPTEHGSYSLKYLRIGGLPHARQVRIGVEGVSERLRKVVNKPISSDDLINCTSWLNENGKSVRWFLIAGLPGEGKDDWNELCETVQRWKRQTPKGTLDLSFTAFRPWPATPMAILPLYDDYWEHWIRFKEWFFGGKGWSNKINIMAPAQPLNRLKNAIASMGLSEKELRQGGSWGPNDRLAYPYKESRNKLAKELAVSLLCSHVEHSRT